MSPSFRRFLTPYGEHPIPMMSQLRHKPINLLRVWALLAYLPAYILKFGW